MFGGNGQQPVMAAVGMFDGVHRGHAFLLRTLAYEAVRAGMRPLAITFARHPQAILRPERAPGLLGGVEQRCKYIKDTFCIDTAVLNLDADGLKMTASEFLEILNRDYGVKALLMGYDNHIGSDRRTAVDLAGAVIPVLSAPPCPEIAVSSSAIRDAISRGEIKKANNLLGHNFTVAGSVVGGHRLGRKIGFPTANIDPSEPAQLLPADGVYAVDVLLDGHRMRGMANIGKRPTVGGEERTFEVHILDFYGDLYGRKPEVQIIARLRDERRFDSLDALSAQLSADRDAARQA